ncbi:MAG: response regulator [Saprospirales bacterium]|jgi:two-component system LytT family response regulator|nr:response regulator [Saprospirales bacterium]MBK8922536.1 response regulator [Saprospirales bacterium]
MTALLVEDMPQALQLLQADLAEHCPDVEVVGVAHSVVEAAKQLQRQTPDILFLDILLGDGTGFDLLEIFPQLDSRIIFVTASDEFALRAFRFAAVDYLLKPVDPAQLRQAVARARNQLTPPAESIDLLQESIRQPDVLPTRIALHTQERVAVVDIDQIVRCEADGNNTWFILASGEKVFVTRTLKQFEQLLGQHGFLRVHQSHLLHPAYIREFIKKDGGYLKLKNGDTAPVSQRKKAEVMEWLEHL